MREVNATLSRLSWFFLLGLCGIVFLLCLEASLFFLSEGDVHMVLVGFRLLLLFSVGFLSTILLQGMVDFSEFGLALGRRRGNVAYEVLCDVIMWHLLSCLCFLWGYLIPEGRCRFFLAGFVGEVLMLFYLLRWVGREEGV